MAEEYDVVILGGGPGGYVAAIRASQLGLKTAVVEKRELGGTCLHRGCIPSKALLRSAEVYRQTKESMEFGVMVPEVKLDFTKVQDRKTGIVDTLHKGVVHLMKKGKIDVFEGTGRILGPSIFSPMPGTISVERNDGQENEMLLPKHVIIATGSRPSTLPGIEVDGEKVLNSDHALMLEELPASMLIIGGGVIGIEWASMLTDFGVEVTVLEYASTILPMEDEEISKEMKRLLQKRGVRIVTEAKVTGSVHREEDGKVSLKAEVKGETVSFSADKILVSTGRKANVEGIGIENTDIVIKDQYIEVNEFQQTKESHIYAIGDCSGGLQLAHVASREGIMAVEHIAGMNPLPFDLNQVSRCIYSSPEASAIGMTEKQAIKEGYDVITGKFSFKGVGKALVLGENDGFVKIVADRKTEDILGIHMIGPHVTDLISEAGLAKVLDATPWELSHTIHPHPSLSEAIGEAALAVDGMAIHS